jgi:GAF domain-containing protein
VPASPVPLGLSQRHVSAFEGATTPRNYSPCGVTLDADQPILARHAERYSWISNAGIVVTEVLLVPLHRGSELLGTLWIVSDCVGHFHRGHVTAICELASFVSVALQMLQTERRLESALAEQEALTGEMSHRIKNLFNFGQGMIQLSSRSADSKEQLAEALTGRVNALAVAHGLIRRTLSLNQTISAAELMP